MTKLPDIFEYITGDYNEKRLFYRHNGRNMRQFEERPDQSKWDRDDCEKCYTPFSIVPMGDFWRCEKCGWVKGKIIYNEEI